MSFYIYYSTLNGLTGVNVDLVGIYYVTRMFKGNIQNQNDNQNQATFGPKFEVKKSPDVVKSERGCNFRRGHVLSLDSSVFINETLKST